MTPIHRAPRPLGLWLLVLFPLVMMMLLLGRVPLARADSYVVTTTADSGPGSLRQAMLDAAASSSAADTITFNIPAAAANCVTDNVCTIRLTSASLPQKTSSGGPLTIDGSGADITIDGRGDRRFISIPSGQLTMIQLRLLNGWTGNYGGAIEVDGGTFTADSITFENNFAGWYGGAISSFGTTNVVNSVFINNIADLGGGAIFVYFGNTNVTNSTFTENKADEGGAILNYDHVTIANSTFYDNFADFSGHSINENGTSIRMTNSLLVRGPNQTSGNCDIVHSTIIDINSTNISSDGSCRDATQKTAAEIAIGDLGDYGGRTRTIALLPGSEAIDFAPSANCGGAGGTDQRGMPRNVDLPGLGDDEDNLCDVGAFEVATDCSGSTFAVDDDVELDDAIRCINGKTSGDHTIEMAADFILYGSTPPLSYSAGAVTVDGQSHTLGHTGNGRHFTFGEDTQVTLMDATLTEGHETANGGSIYNQGALTLSAVDLIANTGTGAIHNEHVLDVAGSRFSQNRASAGGAINNSAVLTTTNTLFDNNNATGNGGAIVLQSTAATSIEDAEFIENTSGANGGAFHINAGAVLTVTNTFLSSNESEENGGGFHNNGTLTVLNSTLSNNGAQSSNAGGGIFNRGTLVVEDSWLIANWAHDGGGISHVNGRLTIANSTFSENTTGGWGAGLFVDVDNPASETATVTNSTFSGNVSHDSGGAVSVDDGRLTVTSSTFYGNSASYGSVFHVYGTVNLFNNLLVDNEGDLNCAVGPYGGADNMTDDNSCGNFTVRTAAQIALSPNLSDNGGPTPTHALLEDSEAIDFIGSGCPTTDQRGLIRPQGSGCDAGAFELQMASLGIGKTTDPPGGKNFPFAIFPLSDPVRAMWGDHGGLAGQFLNPTAVTLDASGSIYVADSDNHRIQKFEDDGTFWLTFGWDVIPSGGTGFEICYFFETCQAGTMGDGAGQFRGPRGVAVDASGNIYAADTNNHRIQKFNSSASFVASFGTSGAGAGQLNAPAEVAVDAAGNVYVADSGNHRVQKFNSDGVFQMAIGWDVVDGGGTGFEVCGPTDTCRQGVSGGGAGQFDTPYGVAVDAAGNIYVTEINNHRVQKFNSDGVFQMAIGWDVVDGGGTDFEVCGPTVTCRPGISGGGAGQFNGPRGVAVEEAGYIYVADSSNSRIQKFDGDGNFVLAFGWDVVDGGGTDFEVCRPDDSCKAGQPGDGVGQLDFPVGVAVDTDGKVYVTDELNVRIQVFGRQRYATLDDEWDAAFTIQPGTYLVSELVPDGWELDDIDCDGGSPVYGDTSATVTLGEGDHIHCAFHNIETTPEPSDPCPVAPVNLIANPCFEDGSAPWTFFTNGFGTYNVSAANPFEGDGSAEVAITTSGSNVQFYQTGISLTGNTAYELTFAARSSNGQDLSVYLHQHGAPYANYGLAGFHADLTDEWQTFSITFSTLAIGSVNDGRLRFWLAPTDTAGTTFHFDRVVLRELDGGGPPPEPDPEPPAVPPLGHCSPPVPGNVIINPGFEAQTSGWKFNTNGAGKFTAPAKPNTSPYECLRNARVKITTQGTSVQLYQSGITLQPNTAYRLRLAARSSGGQDVQLFVHRHSAPYTNYGLNGERLNLTNQWQVFTVDFTTSGFGSATSDARLRLWLGPFDQNGAVYQFDDVVLIPLPPVAREGATAASDGGRAATAPAAPSDAHLVSGYFIDADHAGRLDGSYVGELAGCRNPRVSRFELFPANGRLRVINITNVGSPKNVTITGVWQDEPADGRPDAVLRRNNKQLELRAERDDSAGADGRVYTIRFTAAYRNGSTCEHVVTVGVPLAKGVTAVSGGELFDSLAD